MRQLGRPPGPKGLPLVGVRSKFRKNPAGFLLATAREFGDISYFRVGLRKVYLVSRPDLIDEVLVHSVRFFMKPTPVEPLEIDLPGMAADALAAMSAWAPDVPFDIVAEIRRLFPPMPKPPDPDEEPRSLLDNLVAGHEDPVSPISSAVAWMLIAMAQHPETQQRLRGDPGGEYSKRFVSEVLRLYPPVWTIGRVTRSQFRLYNYLMPPESVCLMSPWVMHRHPRFWPEPDRFVPGRFAPELNEQRPRFAYFPCGTADLCSGRTAALDALVQVATGVASRWRIRLQANKPVEPSGATSVLWPRNPVSIAVSAW